MERRAGRKAVKLVGAGPGEGRRRAPRSGSGRAKPVVDIKVVTAGNGMAAYREWVPE